MVFFQVGEDFGHDDFAEERGLGVYLETGAILIDSSHFAVVEQQYITVLAQKLDPLFFQIGGVHAGDVLST